jgi:hypothetical protein
MDINPEDETSYTTQFQESFLKYVEDEYCSKHQRVPVNKLKTVLSSNLVPSGMVQGNIDHPVMHLICPVMMRNAYRLSMWLR